MGSFLFALSGLSGCLKQIHPKRASSYSPAYHSYPAASSQ